MGLEPGEVVLDFPSRANLFELDLLVRLRSGSVQRLGGRGLPGMLDLPRVGGALSLTARVLRVFTFQRREVPREAVLDLVSEEG